MGKCGWVNLGRASLIAVAALFVAETSSAQHTDPRASAKARELVDEAGALMDSGNFVDACPKLEQAADLLPEGIGAKMALGECYVGMKRFASAWGQYARAEALAIAKGDLRAEEARDEAEKLRPQLAQISISVPESMRNLAGLSVTWNGIEQKPAVWGTSMPVDTGSYIVKAHAPGYVPWSREVVIETDGATIEVTVPALEKVPVEAPKPQPAPPQQPAPPPMKPASRPKPESPSKWMRDIGFAGMAVGATGLIAGSVLGGLAISKQNASNAEGECDENHFCNANGVTLRDEAFGLADASTAMFVVGGVLVGTGTIFVVMDQRNRKESGSEARANIVLQASVAPGWIGLRGVW